MEAERESRKEVEEKLRMMTENFQNQQRAETEHMKENETALEEYKVINALLTQKLKDAQRDERLAQAMQESARSRQEMARDQEKAQRKKAAADAAAAAAATEAAVTAAVAEATARAEAEAAEQAAKVALARKLSHEMKEKDEHTVKVEATAAAIIAAAAAADAAATAASAAAAGALRGRRDSVAVAAMSAEVKVRLGAALEKVDALQEEKDALHKTIRKMELMERLKVGIQSRVTSSRKTANDDASSLNRKSGNSSAEELEDMAVDALLNSPIDDDNGDEDASSSGETETEDTTSSGHDGEDDDVGGGETKEAEKEGVGGTNENINSDGPGQERVHDTDIEDLDDGGDGANIGTEGRDEQAYRTPGDGVGIGRLDTIADCEDESGSGNGSGSGPTTSDTFGAMSVQASSPPCSPPFDRDKRADSKADGESSADNNVPADAPTSTTADSTNAPAATATATATAAGAGDGVSAGVVYGVKKVTVDTSKTKPKIGDDRRQSRALLSTLGVQVQVGAEGGMVFNQASAASPPTHSSPASSESVSQEWRSPGGSPTNGTGGSLFGGSNHGGSPPASPEYSATKNQRRRDKKGGKSKALKGSPSSSTSSSGNKSTAVYKKALAAQKQIIEDLRLGHDELLEKIMDLEQEKRQKGSSTTGKGTPRSPQWDWGEDVTENAGDGNGPETEQGGEGEDTTEGEPGDEKTQEAGDGKALEDGDAGEDVRDEEEGSSKASRNRQNSSSVYWEKKAQALTQRAARLQKTYKKNSVRFIWECSAMKGRYTAEKETSNMLRDKVRVYVYVCVSGCLSLCPLLSPPSRPISDSNPTLFLALFLPQISLLQLKNQQLIKKHNDNGGFAPIEDIDMRSKTIQRRLHGGNGGSGGVGATGKRQGGGMGRRKAALAVQTHVRGWLARSGFDGEKAAKRAQRWRATDTHDATDGGMDRVLVQRAVRTHLHQGMERVVMPGTEQRTEQGTDWSVVRKDGAGGSDEEQSRAERDREGTDEEDGHAITGGAGEGELVRTKPNTPTSPPVYTAGWVKMPASLNPFYHETVHKKLHSAGKAQEGDGDESGGGKIIEGNEGERRGMGRAAGVHRTVSAIDALRSIRSVRSIRFVSEEEGSVKVQRQQRTQHGGAAMSSTTFRASFNRDEPTANDQGGGGRAGGAGVRARRLSSTGMRSLKSIRSIGSINGSIQQRSSMISRLRSSRGDGGDGDGNGDGDGDGGNSSNGGEEGDETMAGAIVEALTKSHRIKVNEYLRRTVSENRDTLTNAIVQSNRHGFGSTFDDVFVNLIMEHFPASEGVAALCDTLEAAEQENISLCMTLQAAKEENQQVQTASAIAVANAAAKTAARVSMDGSKLLEKLEEKATKLGGVLGFIGENGDDGGSGIGDGGGEGGGASIMRLQTTRTAMATALTSAVEGIDVDAIVEEMHDLYDQLDNAETDNMMLEREMNAMQLKLRQEGSEKIQPAHPLWGVACRYAEEREEVQET